MDKEKLKYLECLNLFKKGGKINKDAMKCKCGKMKMKMKMS